jgi:pectate lyase
VILRNLTFKGPGAYDVDGRDNLFITESDHMWIDHCDFQDAIDGCLDISNGSDLISVTWCRFRYLIAPWAGGSGGSDDHRFPNLVGSSDKKDSDAGKLRVTYACCWWDQ